MIFWSWLTYHKLCKWPVVMKMSSQNAFCAWWSKFSLNRNEQGRLWSFCWLPSSSWKKRELNSIHQGFRNGDWCWRKVVKLSRLRCKFLDLAQEILWYEVKLWNVYSIYLNSFKVFKIIWILKIWNQVIFSHIKSIDHNWC